MANACHKSLHLADTPQLGKCRKTAQIQRNCEKIDEVQGEPEKRTKSDGSPNEPGGHAPPQRGPRTASHTGQTRRPPRAATRWIRLRRPATNNTPWPREPKQEAPEQAEEQKTENSDKAKGQRPAGRRRRNPNKRRTRPQAEEQRAENREDVDVRYPQAPWKNNCVSHQCRIRTRDYCTTLVHADPSLSTHVRPCTPAFGPGTSALRTYRVEVGWATAPLFSTASEQVPRMVRADSTGAGHPPQAA